MKIQFQQQGYPGVLVGNPLRAPISYDEVHQAVENNEPIQITEPMFFWNHFFHLPESKTVHSIKMKLFKLDAAARNIHPARLMCTIMNQYCATRGGVNNYLTSCEMMRMLVDLVDEFGTDGLDDHFACRLVMLEIGTSSFPSLRSSHLEMLSPTNLSAALSHHDSGHMGFVMRQCLEIAPKLYSEGELESHPLLPHWAAWSRSTSVGLGCKSVAIGRAIALYSPSIDADPECISTKHSTRKTLERVGVYLVDPNASIEKEAKVMNALVGGQKKHTCITCKGNFITLYHSNPLPSWMDNQVKTFVRASDTGLQS